MMNVLQPMRDWLGVAIRDWPRYRRAFAEAVTDGVSPARGWISLCNRIEHVIANPDGPGVSCPWEWGSDLHACMVWPWLGRKLMAVALKDWPIQFTDTPSGKSGPRVSFIIAHGGRDRLSQLRQTIRSLFAQTGIDLECIVIDQTGEPIQSALPAAVTYRHLAKTGVERGWHKSWAYNLGARAATGDILIFHDGDICAPQRYASEVARVFSQGNYDAASIQRFLFYLKQQDSEEIERSDRINPLIVPTRVFQNWKGGTIAIRRDAFFSLGGFDEGFVDWGGEDDEFFDRCRQTLRHCRFGYLPFVHLWHAPQAGRKAVDNVNIAHIMPWRMGLPASDRVRELSHRKYGNVERPDPARSYKSTMASSSSSAVN